MEKDPYPNRTAALPQEVGAVAWMQQLSVRRVAARVCATEAAPLTPAIVQLLMEAVIRTGPPPTARTVPFTARLPPTIAMDAVRRQVVMFVLSVEGFISGPSPAPRPHP
jgi:hypothetical protein